MWPHWTVTALPIRTCSLPDPFHPRCCHLLAIDTCTPGASGRYARTGMLSCSKSSLAAWCSLLSYINIHYAHVSQKKRPQISLECQVQWPDYISASYVWSKLWGYLRFLLQQSVFIDKWLDVHVNSLLFKCFLSNVLIHIFSHLYQVRRQGRTRVLFQDLPLATYKLKASLWFNTFVK